VDCFDVSKIHTKLSVSKFLNSFKKKHISKIYYKKETRFRYLTTQISKPINSSTPQIGWIHNVSIEDVKIYK
jgi:hypothetical protein